MTPLSRIAASAAAVLASLALAPAVLAVSQGAGGSITAQTHVRST